ncbi:hypothetical protein CLU79DRAFT_859640, partial [Phycomyces nitens]
MPQISSYINLYNVPFVIAVFLADGATAIDDLDSFSRRLSSIGVKVIEYQQKATLEMTDIQDIISMTKSSDINKVLDAIND